MNMLIARTALSALALVAGAAAAFGPTGHHTIGAIADRLIAGTRAAAEVQALLGGLTLEQAAVWADCAKGVSEFTLQYEKTGVHAECAIFESPDGRSAMEDFAARNNRQCQPAPGDEICHKGYHYTDIAVQHATYDSGLVGARAADLVGAMTAALIVLQGGPPPAPFNLKNRREALLVLTHYVGDIHQPLHVGAVYLNAAGGRINPDIGTYKPATFTRGGNQLLIGGDPKAKLHAAWDAVPPALAPSRADALAAVAKGIPITAASLPDWPQAWASETLKDAHKAFAGITFGPKTGSTWPVTLPPGYDQRMTTIKTGRVEAAGARLAQILQSLWP